MASHRAGARPASPPPSADQGLAHRYRPYGLDADSCSGPACLAFLVNVVHLALLVYIAYVENIALAASCPGLAARAGRTIVRGGGAAQTLEATRA